MILNETSIVASYLTHDDNLCKVHNLLSKAMPSQTIKHALLSPLIILINIPNLPSRLADSVPSFSKTKLGD